MHISKNLHLKAESLFQYVPQKIKDTLKAFNNFKNKQQKCMK